MQKDGHDTEPHAVDSTGALELKVVPKRMLILGGGIIGLEMRTNVPNKAVHEAHVAAEVIAGELQGNKELAQQL